MHVLIVGAGEIGQTIYQLLLPSAQGELFDRDPAKVPGQRDLKTAAAESNLVFLCVPAQALPEALGELKSLLPKSVPVAALSKGMAGRSFVHELLFEHVGPERSAVVGGPTLAPEVRSGQLGVCLVAAREPSVISLIRSALNDRKVRVEETGDVDGTAVSGVLKNIYATLLGLSQGVGFGHNAHGWLISRAVAESAQIKKLLGLSAELPGTALLADLAATGSSPYSLNFQAGLALARGEAPPACEGLRALPNLSARLGTLGDLPLLSVLTEVAGGRLEPKSAVERVILRTS